MPAENSDVARFNDQLIHRDQLESVRAIAKFQPFEDASRGKVCGAKALHRNLAAAGLREIFQHGIPCKGPDLDVQHDYHRENNGHRRQRNYKCAPREAEPWSGFRGVGPGEGCTRRSRRFHAAWSAFRAQVLETGRYKFLTGVYKGFDGWLCKVSKRFQEKFNPMPP